MNSAQELLEKYKTEINTHNWNRVEPLLSPDCTFWFTSGTFQGVDQARKSFERTWDMIKEEVYSLADVEWLFANKEAATCTYTYHWAGVIDGRNCEGIGRGTSCFRVENGQWKIVHEHLSAFPVQS